MSTIEEREAARAARADMMARVRNMPDTDRDTLAASLHNLQTVEGHLLSVRNRALLALQAGARGLELSQIGGFDQWRRAGRSVNRGEQALWIAFPRIRREDDGNGGEKEALRGFSVAFIFDRSQTHEMTAEERAAYGRRRSRRGAAGAGPGCSDDRPAPVVAAAVVDDTSAPVGPVPGPVPVPVPGPVKRSEKSCF